MILACILGLLFVLFRRNAFREGKEQVPFGPCIAAAAFFMLLYGGTIINWYLGLAGL